MNKMLLLVWLCPELLRKLNYFQHTAELRDKVWGIIRG